MTSGYILIDKPIGWTSFDIVKKVRNTLKVKKVGHTGTLDPFASGLLIILVGDATKKAQYLTNLDKVYIATARFGEKTDTGDPTGQVIATDTQTHISKEDFLRKIPQILAIDTQTPSKFSAIKIGGKKAYELARKQVNFDIPDRNISIFDFTLLSYDFPYFTYQVHVSKGTYIRTLTEQIADLFGTVALTTELKRTQIGDFHLKDSFQISDISVNSIRPDSLLAPHSSLLTPNSSLCTMHYALCTTKSPVITIGSFDGLHLGHQFALKETLRIANEIEAPAIVITFATHPRILIKHDQKPFLLIDPQKRNDLIKALGIHHIENLTFDEKLASMSALDFLKLIVDKYHPKVIVTGYDTHFGAGRSGNADFLFTHSTEFDFQVVKLPQFYTDTINGVPTIPSSSLIRDLISKGEVDTAQNYLGRPFSITGKVVKGLKIGSKIGYPTINIYVTDPYILIPASGVYFTYTIINDKKYYSATNIGTSPTVKSDNITTIESHLLDYSGDAYDETVETFFLQKIRDEKKCENTQELIDIIKQDIQKIKEIIIFQCNS